MRRAMKSQTFRTWFALGASLLWMASIGVSNGRADSSGERRPAMQISVYNDAGLKHGTLRLAEEEASAIFRSAGIDAQWKNCSDGENVAQASDSLAVEPHAGKLQTVPPCGEAMYPVKLVLHIEKRPRGLVPEVFGIAYLSQDGQGAYCNVFVEPMVELQRSYPVSLDAILGHVAAHEIAHLLLGPNSHSPTGLMRAHWNSRTIEELRRGMIEFNSAQSSAMADRLEFARGTANSAVATMAELAPATMSVLPSQCPNSR